MATLHLLIIEDHDGIVESLTDYLDGSGVKVDAAKTGRDGIAKALSLAPDVIVLDLGLPDIDGLDVCRRLRKEHRLQTPVLMLTARDGLSDKLEGFEAGAHDYLTKPFAPEELEARVRALVRHHPRAATEKMVLHGVSLDPGTHRVVRDGKTVHVTPTGFRILEALMQASPGYCSREDLERDVWGDFPPGSDALRTHMAQLRKTLDKPFATPLIHNRYAVGFRFAAESDED